MERVGIRSRRTVLPLDYIRETRNCETRARRRGGRLLERRDGRAGGAHRARARRASRPRDIGLVIGGSCAPDTVSPAEACNLARRARDRGAGLDVNSACTSFSGGDARALDDAPRALARLRAARRHGVDDAHRRLHGSLRRGALGRRRARRRRLDATRGRARIIGSRLESSPAGNDKVLSRASAISLRRAARSRCSRSEDRAAATTRCATSTRPRTARLHFVGHQANLRMLEAVCKRCDIAPRSPPHRTPSGTAIPARRAPARCSRRAGTSGRPTTTSRSSASARGSPGAATWLRFGEPGARRA